MKENQKRPKKKIAPIELVRLQKFMAQAGIASRRASEKLIEQGRVRVNGQVITQMGVKIDPKRDKVMVDDHPVKGLPEQFTYIMLNKPRYVLSTTDSPEGRKTVLDYVESEARLYPVGRLDFHSEGLILLTNDGDLAQKLSHPSFGHEREYAVLLNKPLDRAALRRWKQGGFDVDGKPVGPMQIQAHGNQGPNWYRVILQEGRKRQIRVVAEALGYQVNTLIRLRIASLKLGNLRPGAWRHLSPRELDRLKKPARVQKSNH